MKKKIYIFLLFFSITLIQAGQNFTKTIKGETFSYFKVTTTNKPFVYEANTVISALQTNQIFVHQGEFTLKGAKNFSIFTPLGHILLKKGNLNLKLKKNILYLNASEEAEINYGNQNLKLPNRDIYFFIRNNQIIYSLEQNDPQQSTFDTMMVVFNKKLAEENHKANVYSKRLIPLSETIEKKKTEMAKYRKLMKKNPSYKTKALKAQKQLKSLNLALSLFQKRANEIKDLRHFYYNELIFIKKFKKLHKQKYNKSLYKKSLKLATKEK